MRQIKLNHLGRGDKKSIYTKNRQYTFSWGNGQVFYSMSIYECNQRLIQANKFYNENLLELNYLYQEVFLVFRSVWPYFEKKQTGQENKIKDCLGGVDYNLTVMCNRCSGVNGPYWVYGWQKKACEFLLETLKVINQNDQVKKNLVILQKIRNIRKRIQEADRSLEALGR